MEGSTLVVGGSGARSGPVTGNRQDLAVALLRIIAVVGLAAYAAHSLFGLGGHGLRGVLENYLFNGLFFIASALCLLRAAWSRRERAAWAALGVGLSCWALGEVLYSLDPAQLAGGFPAPSDFLWLAFYPAAFLTLGVLVRARVREFYASLWLDGLVGALALSALAARFILPPIIAATGGSLGNVVGDLVYPLGDLLLIGFVVAVLAATGWRPGRVLAWVAAGFALGALADVISLYLSATGSSGSGALDWLWPASAVVLGLAAWQPARTSATIVLAGRRLLAFPLGFALSALAVLALPRAPQLGGAAHVLALLTVVGVLVRLSLTFAENLTIVDRSREEALTDALTGLPNRRALLLDLDDVLQSASVSAPRALLMFDLNGFKAYNDNFGHPAGDALLARLGAKLAEAVAPCGVAYRLGGDEFCVLSHLDERSAEAVAHAATVALTESGPGFDLSTGCGFILLPRDARERSTALQLADERLYADKRSGQRADAPGQLRSVLMQVMAEREVGLAEHLDEVTVLARVIGRRMGLEGDELETLVRAAELHDVGKVAVPDAILRKQSPLDPGERAIVERHCEVGERILAAAPAMVPVGRLIRSSHENYDGSGYPDHRRGDEIPLGSRIIAVCDAFHAMTSERPHRRAIDAAEALTRLRAAAGSQFDPSVVDAICELAAEGLIATAAETSGVPSRSLEGV